jgi:hypothetical protein
MDGHVLRSLLICRPLRMDNSVGMDTQAVRLNFSPPHICGLCNEFTIFLSGWYEVTTFYAQKTGSPDLESLPSWGSCAV